MPVAVAEWVPSLHMVVSTEPYVLAEGRSPGVVRSHCTASGVLRDHSCRRTWMTTRDNSVTVCQIPGCGGRARERDRACLGREDPRAAAEGGRGDHLALGGLDRTGCTRGAD